MHKLMGILAVATTVSTSALAAQSVTVGTPNAIQPSCFPFGCPSFHNQFEQIYASSLFSGPIDIASISFYNSVGGGTFGAGTFTIFLSETTASPLTPSGTPSTNVTGPESLFGTFSSPGTAVGSVFTLAGTGFNYDPTLGNLLLDIHFTAGPFNLSPAHFDVFKSPTVSVISDESAFAGDDDTKGSGFVTTFAAATPEPGTMTMMAMGLVGLAAPMLRRRKRVR